MSETFDVIVVGAGPAGEVCSGRVGEAGLSVAVLDMDWHLVDIDPSLGSGWTGYTFNRELFPDPPAFMAELHARLDTAADRLVDEVSALPR